MKKPRTGTEVPKTLSNRAGHGSVAWSGVGRSWPASSVTGVWSLSAPVVILMVSVPAPLRSHGVAPPSSISPTPTKHWTSSAAAGRCTVSSAFSISCFHPCGMRFQ